MASDTGKKARHDDRISNLFDFILCNILSSLPIKDAVSTSILSTRWRHLYAYMELDLAFVRESDNIPVLSTALLFTVKTLVRLKLEFPFLMTVPVRVCLPSLMTLELHRIKFEDDDSFKRLISSCPVLEQLSISCCDMRSITCLKISNHSLKSLTLVLNWYTPDSQLFSLLGTVFDLPCLVYFKYVAVLEKNNSMGNMLSLVVADTNISVGGFVGETIYHQPGLVGILEGIGNVKSLHMSICPEVVSELSCHFYLSSIDAF
ncbi:hypothetical protein V6N13_013199 [Hibiscus sabdariffa]